MNMVSITEIRRNAKAVFAEVVRTKKPVAVLQRSKPVAYIIDADSFTKMQQQEMSGFAETRRQSLANILQLKEQVAKKGSVQQDYVKLIRDLREGLNRYE